MTADNVGIRHHATHIIIGQRNAETNERFFEFFGINKAAAVLVNQVEHVTDLLIVGSRLTLTAAFHQQNELAEINRTIT